MLRPILPASLSVMRCSFKRSFLALLIFSCVISSISLAEDERRINGIISQVVDQKDVIRIKGSGPFVSTVYELPNPARIIVDIADAKPSDNLDKEIHINRFKVNVKYLSDVKPPITRVEFVLPENRTYSSQQDGNDMLLVFNPAHANDVNDGAGNVAESQANDDSFVKIDDIKITNKNNQTNLTVIANGQINEYSNDTVAKNKSDNPQLIVDLKNVTIDDSLLKVHVIKNSSVSKIQLVKRGTGIRIVLFSSSDNIFPFNIVKISNGLSVLVDDVGRDQLSNLITQKRNIEGQLPEVNPLDAKLSPQAKEQQMQDAFNFSGYNKDRITVEFQKMDLHNVFNFLRQVSGVNIVVDESVQGSLTLVLDDVPWDFALDIILNLKDLEKEERFNTLVIYPKGKGFHWPEQAQNNLSFQADSAVIEQESLVIQQQEKQSVEVIEAKQLIASGRDAEKRENFETAVKLYEEALHKWQNNTKLSNKIATLYLIKLRQNAKALYFSKRALQIDPKNNSALLNAAVASANMQDFKQADDYFKLCTSSAQPQSEALLSFAAFNEDRHRYSEALELLVKHDTLHGATLDSMIASARIYDKMGKRTLATERYQAILSSGFQMPPDLSKYIQGRVALK
jgi:type IV pilus assembly protein PilQ